MAGAVIKTDTGIPKKWLREPKEWFSWQDGNQSLLILEFPAHDIAHVQLHLREWLRQIEEVTAIVKART